MTAITIYKNKSTKSNVILLILLLFIGMYIFLEFTTTSTMYNFTHVNEFTSTTTWSNDSIGGW